MSSDQNQHWNRILIVDDEPDLCEILKFNFVAGGYDACVAHSAEEALELDMTEFDLVLLDVMMDGMSGFDLARLLKTDERTAHLPIIFLTARDTEDDTLHGFSLGADDYVSKPFSVREVMARAGAVIGRCKADKSELETTLQYRGLLLNRQQRTVEVDGIPCQFTRTEFDLLWLLMSYKDKVFARADLLDKVWPANVVVGDRTVDVNLARIRRKIGPYAQCIISRSGVGYAFDSRISSVSISTT